MLSGCVICATILNFDKHHRTCFLASDTNYYSSYITLIEFAVNIGSQFQDWQRSDFLFFLKKNTSNEHSKQCVLRSCEEDCAQKYKRSRPEVFWKDVLNNLAKFTRKHLCWNLSLNKVAANLLENRLQSRCFPVNFEKFLRTLLVPAS